MNRVLLEQKADIFRALLSKLHNVLSSELGSLRGGVLAFARGGSRGFGMTNELLSDAECRLA